ncbi:FkbM family methyltransferase [Telluria aromaticivorans]|uniref:FkbM family methyltransferase n=1 Tax=Telluria aromaticivorans TaxID=2725995 RepID=A0A7Y2JY83_9BURK|nr:FkbM family methyltransferase [Telluria aromaticivorans]NNG22943.1 FkbM family methyltransferase [Telluria aromaticivorans]
MTLISYAQNLEDVLLWRVLGHVKNGFYIDVGANDPEEHSVTKAFYDAGWRGISIEPLPSFHQAFLDQRPRDVNLAVAAGSSDGELTLYDVPAVRGWASPDQMVAELHRSEGHEVAELTVPVRTLASVCEEHVQGEIHFLKVDVEGFEGEVLRGMDFVRWRPWVLVIEATLPNSRATNHASWEHLVTGQRYRFAWFDGLNRYYVAEEHTDLMAHFGIQPNVFDDYISHHLDKAWASSKALTHSLRESERHAAETGQRADAIAREAAELHDRLDTAWARAEQLAQEKMHADASIAALQQAVAAEQANAEKLLAWAKSLEATVIATHNSTSWKITRPVRALGNLVHSLRRPELVRRILTRLTRNEALRRLLIPVLLRFPPLGRRVQASLAALKQLPPEPLPEGVKPVPDALRGVPASVRGVLADLERARHHHTSR